MLLKARQAASNIEAYAQGYDCGGDSELRYIAKELKEAVDDCRKTVKL